jgi:tetratricopeptide (TPR) repeat protein
VDRRRLLAVVAAALLGAAIVVVVAVAGRSPEPRAAPARTGAVQGQPPLVLDLGARYTVDGTATQRLAALERKGDYHDDGLLALAVASARFDTGDVDGARDALDAAAARLGSGDERVQVGRALLSYDPSDPGRALQRLQNLQSDRKDPFPRFEEGLVLLFAGRQKDAAAKLRAARNAAPDSSYALRADNALHPQMRIGYPLWVPTHSLPEGSTAALAAAARRQPDSVTAQLALAAALQQQGRRTLALAAARKALQADPRSVDAQVASVVLAFSKDRPQQAFGGLGNLIKAEPEEASPVFHLGLLLIWLEQRKQAIEEFRKAARLDPDGVIGKVAAGVVAQAS